MLDKTFEDCSCFVSQILFFWHLFLYYFKRKKKNGPAFLVLGSVLQISQYASRTVELILAFNTE